MRKPIYETSSLLHLIPRLNYQWWCICVLRVMNSVWSGILLFLFWSALRPDMTCCMQCEEGYSSDSGAANCTACPAGMIVKNATARTRAEACSVVRFCDSIHVCMCRWCVRACMPPGRLCFTGTEDRAMQRMYVNAERMNTARSIIFVCVQCN